VASEHAVGRRGRSPGAYLRQREEDIEDRLAHLVGGRPRTMAGRRYEQPPPPLSTDDPQGRPFATPAVRVETVAILLAITLAPFTGEFLRAWLFDLWRARRAPSQARATE
jgi:hypothetical protein